MTGRKAWLQDLAPAEREDIRTASGEDLKVEGVGSVQIGSVKLQEVLYAPGLAVNLLAVRAACAAGFDVIFDKYGGTISRDGVVALRAPLTHKRVCRAGRLGHRNGAGGAYAQR